MALEVANEDMRQRHESLTGNGGKIETVNKLVRNFDDDIANIAYLRRDGERRIADLERDLRRRLEEEVGNLETRLKASRKGLYAFINVAPPLIASIESKMKEAALDRFVDVASRLDDLTRLVDDAISEPVISIPDSLPIQPLWPLPTATPTAPVLALPPPPPYAADDPSSSSVSLNPSRMRERRLRKRTMFPMPGASPVTSVGMRVLRTPPGHHSANP